MTVVKKKLGPNLNLLKRLRSLNLNTPLIYEVESQHIKMLFSVIKSGADRILIENLVHKDLKSVLEISDKIGSQSIISSIPLLIKKNNLFQYNYEINNLTKITNNFKTMINEKLISEIIIMDCVNEGFYDTFNRKIN